MGTRDLQGQELASITETCEADSFSSSSAIILYYAATSDISPRDRTEKSAAINNVT
jgi:hypothetical protein